MHSIALVEDLFLIPLKIFDVRPYFLYLDGVMALNPDYMLTIMLLLIVVLVYVRVIRWVHYIFVLEFSRF